MIVRAARALLVASLGALLACSGGAPDEGSAAFDPSTIYAADAGGRAPARTTDAGRLVHADAASDAARADAARGAPGPDGGSSGGGSSGGPVGGGPSGPPADDASSAPPPAPPSNPVCCFGGAAYDCPTDLACYGGFDVGACVLACDGGATCIQDCALQADATPPDASCARNASEDVWCT